MDKLIIDGGLPVNGTLDISGSKNAALPILTASLLTDESVKLTNLPHLQDVTTMLSLLSIIGCQVKMISNMGVILNADSINQLSIPEKQVGEMRASILILGPLLSKYGRVRIAFPGGCAIGPRPINLHLKALEKLGAKIKISDEFIEATAPNGLQGNHIKFESISVGATENIIMAASLAQGVTTIDNAAEEPEIVDLANFINAMGGKVENAGQSQIKITGVKQLFGCEYEIMPDRIETGTYLAATVATKGEIVVRNADPTTLTAVLEKFEECGADIQYSKREIHLKTHGKRPKPVNITTMPYPGFPTDMQAQFTAINAIADGKATVTETIFENRLSQVYELIRMGADITVDGNRALVVGKESLNPTSLLASDLRASASLVIGALIAKGRSEIYRIYHIDRGYECIEEKFSRLGISIKRLPK